MYTEQPYWVRQLLNLIARLFLEKKPKRATAFPKTREKNSPTEDSDSELKALPKELDEPQESTPEKHAVPEEVTDEVSRQEVKVNLKVVGVPSEDKPQTSDIYQTVPPHFDNIEGWVAAKYRRPFYETSGTKLKYKGRVGLVRATQRTHIGCHITAVEFGTSSSRRAFWLKELAKFPTEIRERYQLESDEATAERLALHERFWKVPYHVVGLVNGDILHNNNLRSYTYHGKGLNDEAIGLSAEAKLPGLISKYDPNKYTKVDDHWVETNRKAFEVAYELAMEEGMPIQGVRCHRQSSSGRVADPGEQYYKLVLRPMAERLGLRIDINYTTGSGSAIPVEWDDRGVINYYGKLVKK